jgi:Na+-translocating ferredoxin:NAD+ oxidoreductase RnfG subunit
MPKHGWTIVPMAMLVAPLPAEAMRYLSTLQAQRLMFPLATAFEPQNVALDATQWRRIDTLTPAPVAARVPRVWAAMNAGTRIGYLYVDDVVGKQLAITYAVAIDLAGTVASVEILDYRESHGEQIRTPRWRAQFAGKNSSDVLELNRDIKNISGATLSSRHVTQGIKRLLAIHHARFAPP